MPLALSGIELMSYHIPPVTNHKELTPEEVNQYRRIATDFIKDQGEDEGVTTCLVVTVYPKGKRTLELRGITNPGLKRFRAVIIQDNDLSLGFDSNWIRPPYDTKLANRRSKE